MNVMDVYVAVFCANLPIVGALLTIVYLLRNNGVVK